MTAPPRFDLPPPSDLAAECATLGAMLMEREAISRVRDILKPQDFYSHQNALVYRVACELNAEGQVVDVVTVQSKLTDVKRLEAAGGVLYLHSLLDHSETSAAAEHYALIVLQKSKLRQLIAAADNLRHRTLTEGNEGECGVDQLCSDMAEQLYRIGISQSDDMLDFGVDLGFQTYDELERQRTSEGKLLGIDTGIEQLNRYMPGWAAGSYNLIAARPSAGKSALALQMCLQAAKDGKRVLFFSLEMPTTMVGRRFVAHSLPRDLSVIMEAKLSSEDMRRVGDLFMDASKWRFRFCPTPGLTVSEIRARARTWAAKWGGVDLIVVDYLQLVEADERTTGEVARVTQISRRLKTLARETNAALLALSQLNRDSEKDRRWPQKHDLRESGSLEQDADTILFLYYPYWLVGRNVQDPECKSISGWTEQMRGVYLAKNRQGRLMMGAMHWNGGHQAFAGMELDREEER